MVSYIEERYKLHNLLHIDFHRGQGYSFFYFIAIIYTHFADDADYSGKDIVVKSIV